MVIILPLDLFLAAELIPSLLQAEPVCASAEVIV
jgi:hypothetical protein